MLPRTKQLITSVLSLILILAWMPCPSAQEPQKVDLHVRKLAGTLYLLRDTAGMGNTVALTGEEGVLLVDTKARAASDLLFDRISELSPNPLRFVVITHWHFDHIGGNGKAAKAGAVIIAHENTRKQMNMAHDMQVLNVKVPPSPAEAMPVITFEKKMVFHLNGEEVKVLHRAPGHTDGDAVVFFQKANVICMGDLYFEGLYPYIGIYSGGSINGMIEVINDILPLIGPDTRVIPGHGPVSDKKRLTAYVAMLITIRDKVSALIREGRSMEEVVAARPTREFDAKWGHGFLPPDRFTGLVYMDLSPDLP